MSQTLTQTVPAVHPVFDGAARLPRIEGWRRMRAGLDGRSGGLPSDLLEHPVGRRWRDQAGALGLTLEGASARLRATPQGFEAEVSLKAGGRRLEELWRAEVDEDGVVRGLSSDHGTERWIYEAGSFSLLVERLLSAG